MKCRYMAAASLMLLALVILGGCLPADPGLDEDKPETPIGASARTSADPGAPATPYASPQEVFDAYIQAIVKGDYGTLYQCLTPKDQKQVVADEATEVVNLVYRWGGSVKRPRARDKLNTEEKELRNKKEEAERANYKQILANAAKYGLTEDAVKKLSWEKVTNWDPTTIQQMLDLIKDHKGFVVSQAVARDKRVGRTHDGKVAPRVKLLNLTVAGDKANGFLSVGGGPRQRIYFAKLGGGWRIQLNLTQPKPLMGKDKSGHREKDKSRPRFSKDKGASYEKDKR